MIVRLVALLLGLACTISAVDANPAAVDEGKKLREMEHEQERLYQRAKDALETVKDPAKREQLKGILAEIERRMREGPLGKVYLSPRSELTPEMNEFHGRLIRKIEDCGTRHLPKRNGKTVYGKGIVGVTLDPLGKVVGAEVLESSRDKTIDGHIRKVIWSSSPFGQLPAKLTAERSTPYNSVVILTAFEFKSDDVPFTLLPDNEACKWKN